MTEDGVTLGQPIAPDEDLFAHHLSSMIARGRYANGGPLVEALEHALQELLDVPCAVLTSSGTAALTLSLMASDLPEGSDVITTPLTCTATAQAILAAGHRPTFVDVDPLTGTLDPEAVEAAVTSRTAGILGVHLFGTTCDDTALTRVAQKTGAALVYDAAHCFDRASATLPSAPSSLSTFSLHATKLMHTGEGGLVTSRTPYLRERLERTRNFGLVGGATLGPGQNFKMAEVNAALGLAVLPKLEAERQARRALRRTYDEILAHHEWCTPFSPPVSEPELFYALVAPAGRRDRLQACLRHHGVISRIFEPLDGDHSWFATRSERHPTPHAQALASNLLCLPFHSGVSERDVAAVSSCLSMLG